MVEIDYSVVVPVYNEEGNLRKLDKEIKSVMSKLGTFEIIYIDDCSSDGSLEELSSLKGVKIIHMNRNYGQATALDAGFKATKGKIVVSLDGDGQNDPADIPKLLDKMKKDNLDVVTGWRKNRADKKGIRILTRVGRFMRHVFIKDQVHDTGCTLRVYAKEAAKSLDLQGEMHRYILALLRWKGFKIGEVVVNDRAREHGVSKYNYSKAERGFLDLIYISFVSKYSQRPLHLFGRMSWVSVLLGLSSGVLAVIDRIQGLSLNRNGWFFLAIFFLLAGVMFFSFGILMDLLMKIYLNSSPNEKRYYVREVRAR
jgi:glycosyltransferase involved in cell wall biosynthesis